MSVPFGRSVQFVGCTLGIILALRGLGAVAAETPRFSVSIPASRGGEPLDGRLLLLLSTDGSLQENSGYDSPGVLVVPERTLCLLRARGQAAAGT